MNKRKHESSLSEEKHANGVSVKCVIICEKTQTVASAEKERLL